MGLLATSLIALATVLVLMTFLWLVSLAKKDASIIDPVWGLGFVVVAWLCIALNAERHTVGWLMVGLVTVWGLRLSAYLFIRNWGKPEDRRYHNMRKKHGDRFWWISLFTVFWLQAVLLWFISLPIQAAIQSAEKSHWVVGAVAIVLWVIGFAFESIGDYQMAKFKSQTNNDGAVLNHGLWRYTRHPNYFGDFCVWWGHYFLAASVGAWWTVLSPALMSFLLMRVSGVKLLESDIEDRRPKYREYKRNTNAFFPGPGKG